MPLLRTRSTSLPTTLTFLGYGGQSPDSTNQGEVIPEKEGAFYNEPFIITGIPEHRPNYVLDRIAPYGQEDFDATRERIKSKVKDIAIKGTAVAVVAGLLAGAIATIPFTNGSTFSNFPVWETVALVATTGIGAGVIVGGLGVGTYFGIDALLGERNEKFIDKVKSSFRNITNNIIDLINFTNTNDFLLRNGLRSIPTVAEDFTRITRFMKTEKGYMFMIKQQLLERQNVKIPSRRDFAIGGTINDISVRSYNPIGTLAQVGANFVGGHFNKQGLNPFELSYYIGGRFNYWGDSQEDRKESIEGTYLNYKNRLIQLTLVKINNRVEDSLIRNNTKYSIGLQDNILISYNGGSGVFAPLGIGKSTIRIENPTVKNPSGLKKNSDDTISKNNDVYVFSSALISQQNSSFDTKDTSIKLDFRQSINSSSNNNNINYLPSTDYSVFNREKTYETSKTTYRGNWIGSRGRIIDPEIPISKDYLEEDLDIVTLQFRVFNAQDNKSSAVTTSDNGIPFNFVNVPLNFRAYIENWSDSWKSNWKEIKYIGRGNPFYKYDGFTRNMQLTFLIPALSKADLDVNYAKLNALLWSIVPDYSSGRNLDGGFMKGNLVEFNMGGYIDDYVIINNIEINEIEGMGWDIGPELPKGIKVNIGITPLNINITPRFGDSLIGPSQSDYPDYDIDLNPYPISSKDSEFKSLNENFADEAAVAKVKAAKKAADDANAARREKFRDEYNEFYNGLDESQAATLFENGLTDLSIPPKKRRLFRRK